MSDSFYRAFEEKHRGSRELIKSRLLVYLPFIEPVLEAYPESQSLDIGCGRGEWLELLREHGFDAKGVDLDDGMLQACRERGLHVETADALTYLERQPSGCLAVVSGFHIAEHLPFQVLKKVVREAKRVLVPGGLLILETPNPENISVGTSSFYLDPTHERPIPPELLSFLPEFYGFKRHKVLRLQESAQLHYEMNPRLMHVLAGASPDYAVVAQSDGSASLLESLDPLFEKSYGLTLHDLAEKFQQAFDRRLVAVEGKAEQAEAKAEKAEAASERYAMQLAAVYRSTSWRITAPMRWLGLQWRLYAQHGFKVRARALAKKVIGKLVVVIMARPRLKIWVKRIADRVGLSQKLKRLILSSGSSHTTGLTGWSAASGRFCYPTELSSLSAQARRIHSDLETAVSKNSEGER